MGYSKYVGRVGALAIALGVGCAVGAPGGVAWAETTESATSAADSAPSDTSTGAPAGPSAGPDAPVGQDIDAPGDGADAGDRSPSDPAGAPSPGPSSPTASTEEVAPGVVVSSSGGAQTSTDDEEPDDEIEDTDEVLEQDENADDHTDGRDRDDADAAPTANAPTTQTNAQTVQSPGTRDQEPAGPSAPALDPAETADVAVDGPAASLVSTPLAAPPPVTIQTIVESFFRPILSRIFDAIPGGPGSPFGWLLLGAARRQIGVDVPATTLAADSTPGLLSLAAAAGPLPEAEVIFQPSVPATGAVSGEITPDAGGGTPRYTVTTPPAGGNLVFDSATGKFTYTPTAAQRIAAGLSGNTTIAMTVTVTDGTTSVDKVVNIPISGYSLSNGGQTGGIEGAHAVAVNGTRAYVTNKSAGTVTVIDTVTNSVVRTYTVGASPDGIAVKHDGTAMYVTSMANNTVTVVNTSTGALKVIKVATPSAVAVHPNGSVLYVTSLEAGTLRKISLRYWTSSTVKLPTGSRPTGIVISPDGTRLYVVSSTATGGGLVSLMGSTSMSTMATLSSAATAIAVSPDNKRLFVTGADGTLHVIDAVTKAVLGAHAVGSDPAGVAVSGDGSAVFVTDNQGVVKAFDAATGALLGSYATRPVGVVAPLATTPPRIARSADGTKLYVTDAAGGTVHVVALPAMNSVPLVTTPVLGAPNTTSGAVIGKVGATDPDRGDVLKYTLGTKPTKGTITVRADGTFTYTPTAAARHAASAVGATTEKTTDTFTVTVTDAKGAAAMATITVDILPANRAPVPSASVGTPNTTTGVVTGKVTATDGDKDLLKYTATTGPTKGTVTVNATTGAFTYTPTGAARHQAAKVGATTAEKTDTFTVTVDDGHGGVVTKTVTVSIRPANAAPGSPTVSDVTTDTGTGVVTGKVTFTDLDNDSLAYRFSETVKGSFEMQQDGTFKYKPSEIWRQAAAVPGATAATKTEVVTVTVTDGFGGTATLKLTLNIAPAVPGSGGYQASNPTLAIGTVTGKITAVDPTTGSFTYTVGAGPTKGLVKVDKLTGAFVYVPNVDSRYAAAKTPGFDTDTFTVTVTDALGKATTVSVTVDVAPPISSAMDQRSTTIAVTAQEMYFFNQADTDKALDLLKAAGVNNIRILVPWMGVEALDDWWSWGAVDRMVNSAYARNIEVLAVLNSPPIWASVPNVPLLTGRPNSAAEFAEYAGKVAARYAGKISAYEVWNEPNYIGFWAPGPNAAQYVEILKAAYPVIKAADPDAVVVAGSVASVLDFLNITANPVRFVKEMYAAGAAGYFDALSFHPYLTGMMFSKGRTTPQAPWWQANEIYKLMVANGDGNKKIWATEYGQPSHLVSEASQAAFIDDFLKTWRTLSYAGPAFIQTIKDNTEADANAANMGLFRKDWTAKPAMSTVAWYIIDNMRLIL